VHAAWLTTYGISSDHFSFAEASFAVGKKLNERINLTLAECIDAFERDISERVSRLEGKAGRLDLSATDLDQALKRAEFEQQFPKESFSSELRELHYRIVRGEGDSARLSLPARRGEA
jgi:hypothetical protein